MIVVRRSPSASGAIARATLAACGVDLAAGSEGILKGLAPGGHVRGASLAPSGLTLGTREFGTLDLAMQPTGESIAASTSDLRTINDRHSASELSADDVSVFQDFALSTTRANDRPVQFTTEAIEILAKQAAEGRSVCFGHDHREQIGATFAGDVVDETVRDIESTWLRLRWFGVTTDDTSPARRQRLLDCRTGVLRFGSVGVAGGDWQFVEVEGPDGPEFFYLIGGSDDLLLREYSRVTFGAMTGAGDHKYTASGDRQQAPTPPSKTRRVVVL